MIKELFPVISLEELQPTEEAIDKITEKIKKPDALNKPNLSPYIEELCNCRQGAEEW